MCIKIPVFTKCCLCAPLREGLLSYAYTHLLLCVLGIGLFINAALKTYSEYDPGGAMGASLIFCLFIAIDAVFLVILIIACHKKYVTLLMIPHIYNKMWLILCVVVAIPVAIRVIVMYKEATASKNFESGFISMGILYFGLPMLLTLACDICLRWYVILWINGLMNELLISEQLSIKTNYDSVTSQPTIHTEDSDALHGVCGVIGNIENNDNTLNAENDSIEVTIEESKRNTKQKGISKEVGKLHQTEEDIKVQITNQSNEVFADESKDEDKEKCNAAKNLVLDLIYCKTDGISEENAMSKLDIELHVLQ